jgi:uncharacterized protein YqeY
MREQLTDALKDAMKAQDKRRLSTLRLITAAIKDRDIAARTAGKDRIGDSDILEVLAKMIKQRRESVKIYEEAGRLELAQQEQNEIDVIESFLPQQLGDDEMQAAVKTVISELGADGLKDMGRVMSELKARHAGQMDFGKASGMVKSALT